MLLTVAEYSRKQPNILAPPKTLFLKGDSVRDRHARSAVSFIAGNFGRARRMGRLTVPCRSLLPRLTQDANGMLTSHRDLDGYAPVAQRIEHLPCRSLDEESRDRKLIKWTTPYAGTPLEPPVLLSWSNNPRGLGNPQETILTRARMGSSETIRVGTAMSKI